ncbi:MAG: tetratricopeptide repeat protein, partial [Candidatus Uhrbacteria bacterium]|nr:tetratricopeptide repeat protein [Candidatus Uhrbacteria bacterium]
LASQAEEASDVAITAAEMALNTAISLKSDYASARYFLAFVLEHQGKLAEAIRSMELVRATNPSDVGVSMQLSLFYLRQGKNILAKQELERATALVPNYANAHWYLASILEQEGDTEGALAELRIVDELNPNNETVEKRMKQLEDGMLADPLPEPLEPSDSASLLPSTPTAP